MIDLDTFGFLGDSNAFEAISGFAGHRNRFSAWMVPKPKQFKYFGHGWLQTRRNLKVFGMGGQRNFNGLGMDGTETKGI